MNRNAGLWSWIWSEQVLFSTTMLWLLFWINLGGTLYGYVWYWDQLVLTYETMNSWLLLYVPDSPTASLFFTLSLGFMIMDRSKRLSQGLLSNPAMKALRGFIDAFAIITLIKYGVWAVTMNFADGYQGGGIAWQQWMLIVSHAGMVVQAILYAKLMRYHLIAVATVAVWTLTNDYLDYHAMIHPWLYGPLEDDLAIIEVYTITLSILCIAIAIFAYFRTSMKEKL